MHSRNIYRVPPNFAELRSQFPEFAEKIQVDVDGKLKLDFKDQEAVRVLTKCCLKKDFKLDVEIPADKLMPTLPLRLNYILWIEDLLNHCGINKDIIGVDIGTGACCIYCLLAARMNKNWRFFGLEIDKENVEHANDNILRNKLTDRIKIVDQEGSDKIFDRLFNINDSNKTFTICNPPFYSSKEEMLEGENRTGKRKKLDHQSPMRESTETVFNEGGEFGFVSKILKESLELKEKIEIYSTMFGCKKNFLKFQALLQSNNIKNSTSTELVQGKVYRWAIAWSFVRNISDFKNETPSQKSDKPYILKHVIHNVSFVDAHTKLLNIFNDLKMTTKLLKGEDEKVYQYELVASENTWSNQRRKRRAEQRNEDLSSLTNSSNTQNQHLRIGFEISCTEECHVNIQIFFIEGTMKKDSVNQILQYIKNNLKL